MEYTVKDGRIRDLGKYEGEPAWVPHMYQQILEGGCDTTIYDEYADNHTDVIIINDDDRERYNFAEHDYAVAIWTTEQGFTHGETISEGQYIEICNR